MIFAKNGIRALAALAALPATHALAQLPPNIVVTFDAAATGVPVGGAATWIASIGIVALALWFVRRYGNVIRTTALMLATAGVLTMASLGSPSATAVISVPYEISLVSSPATVIFGTAPSGADNYLLKFNNTTGQQITLRGLTITNAGGLSIAPSTTCTVGLVISAGASCTVSLLSSE